MGKRSINIERLEIRLKGISAQAARAAVDDLGHELLGELSKTQNLPGGKRASNIARVDSGTVQLAPGSLPAELRTTIAGRIAASIKSKMGRASD